MKTITSAENPRFRALLKLAQSARERRTSGLSLLDGVHLVAAYRDHLGKPAEMVLSQDGLENPEVAALLSGMPDVDAVLFFLETRTYMDNPVWSSSSQRQGEDASVCFN